METPCRGGTLISAPMPKLMNGTSEQEAMHGLPVKVWQVVGMSFWVIWGKDFRGKNITTVSGFCIYRMWAG